MAHPYKDRQILFIHLPKVAGTFLSEYAKVEPTFNYYLNKGKAHCPASSVKNRDKYILVGFVRNPWDWYVSRYHYFIKKKDLDPNYPHKEKGLSKYSDAGLWGIDFQDRFPTLKSHIEFGLKSGRDNFWMLSLFHKMFFKNDRCIMDYIGRSETLIADINNIYKTLEIVPQKYTIELFTAFVNDKTPELKNSSEHQHYSKYYDVELANIIAQQDYRIIQKFGYYFDVQ